MKSTPRTPLLLKAGIQHYDWGDPDVIPEICGIPNPERLPHAELWMGAHPALPSTVALGGRELGLDEAIARATVAFLGRRVAKKYGRLPFLLKLLAAEKPLSIQAHPTKALAEEGFARENAAGIPLDARERNYRDDNHKPELIVSFSDLHVLCGFRPFEEIEALLAETPELRELAPAFSPGEEGLRRLFETLMTLPQGRVDAALTPLLERARAAVPAVPARGRSYWLLRADEEFSRDGHRDRGLFALLLLNLFHLEPTQALSLDAGVLHAYLHGFGVEIMANSDNVLRCGLTSKHVDVPELLRTVVFRGERPRVLEAQRIADTSWHGYATTAEEFELQLLVLDGPFHSASARAGGPEILFVVDGADVRVSSDDGEIEMSGGASCFVPAGTKYDVEVDDRAILVRAGVPTDRNAPPASRRKRGKR